MRHKITVVNIGVLATFIPFINNPKTININIFFFPIFFIYVHIVIVKKLIHQKKLLSFITTIA